MQPNTRTIDGFTYELQPLPAWHAVEVFHTITRLLAPSLGALTAADPSAGIAALSSGLEQALVALPAPAFVSLSKRLLEGARVTIDGKSVELLGVADLHFRSRTLALFKVVAAALQINFPDFFGALGGIGARLRAAASKALDQPIVSTTTGPAGG